MCQKPLMVGVGKASGFCGVGQEPKFQQSRGHICFAENYEIRFFAQATVVRACGIYFVSL
jgi:hypothetical protein